MRDSFRGVSDIQYSCCRNRARVYIGLSVRISVSVSVPCNSLCCSCFLEEVGLYDDWSSNQSLFVGFL